MPQVSLTDSEQSFVWQALQLAKDKYVENAAVLTDPKYLRLRNQFLNQADEAARLAEKIEEAE